MTGWQIDVMAEAADARIWEELNAPDPCEPQMLEAAASLQVAIKHLDKALDWVMEAEGNLDGTPMQHVVGSYEDEIISIMHGLHDLREKYGRGLRD